jgi:Putative MetA-pathway of phenol degradation
MANTRIRSKAFLMLLALLVSVPASSQTPSAQDDHSTQVQSVPEPDLINPDRPGIADGSTVVGSRTFQIESGIQLEFRRSDDSREHTFFVPSLLRFGIGSHWEARIEGNTFTRVTSFDSETLTEQSSGFAPTSLGLKYHIYHSNGDHQISLGTIVRIFPEWGSKEFHAQHTTGDIRLAADWNFAPKLKLSVNPNIGIARSEDDQGKLFTCGLFAITLNYLPTKKLNPFIDVGIQSPEAVEGRSSAVLDGGLAYTIGHNMEIDASMGTRVHGITGPQPFVAFGLSWRSKLFHGNHGRPSP